jgi:cytochrome P450
MLTLHHQPDRRETYDALRPFHFDQHLKVLCVYDKELIAAIFRSEDFRINAFADHYRTIAERTGIDFQASIATLDHIPFSKEGDEHKRLRTEMAAVVSADSREHIAGMETFINELVKNLFVSGKEIELNQQLGRAIFYELFSRWLKVDQREFMKESNISQVFDGAMSLNRRKKVNGDLHELTCAFAERRERMPTTPEFAVAMNVLGNDALMGSLVLSTWHILEQNPGARLSDIEFPTNLPATGVPFIERIANRDVEIKGLSVAKDQKVRLMIDATSRQVTGEEADLFFGKGRHLCIGKPMTLIVWRSFAKAVMALPLRFTLGEMRLRTGDYAFSYPEYARVRLHD